MGTLGCVNDMLQRDKENRSLRQINRERMRDTYYRLLATGGTLQPSSVTPDKLADIRKNTLEKEALERKRLNRVYGVLSGVVLALLVILLFLQQFF